jgi:hypothetical protein
MGAVGNRINTALKFLQQNDFENALINISIAIDKTAKKKYRIKGVGERIKKFIYEYESFIYQFAMNGEVTFHVKGKIEICGKELHDIVYKSIRCALLHEGEIGNNVEIVNKVGIMGGTKEGKFIINKGHIDALLFSVISEDVNKNEKCDSGISYTHHFSSGKNNTMKINELWGNLKKIEELTNCKKYSREEIFKE